MTSRAVGFVPILAAVLLAASGCAATGSLGTGAQHRTAQEQLARRAAAEARRSPRTLREVPIPPGVEPEVLRPRPASDTAARLSFDEAIRQISDRAPVVRSELVAAPQLQDDERDRALGHYIRGRDAALQNRHLVAIHQLEQAAAIDPASPAILRQLARSYLAVHNSLKAAGLYEQLLRLEPDDSETLFMLGLAATNRRDFERAVSYLVRPYLAGTSFDHDPAADYLARYMLASALRQLGYDRAWIEASRIVLEASDPPVDPTRYASRVESLYRQRADVWRAIGDSYCRLSEYRTALEAYREAARLPTADPEALHPRVLYANLRLGRVWGAQLEMLAAVGDGATPVTERDIRLCGYVGEHAGSMDLLAEAVVDRHRAHPDDPSLVRAAAVLLPSERSLQLLRDFLDRRPDDLEVLWQLLSWLTRRDEPASVDLTIALGSAHPLLAASYGDQLAAVGPSTSRLLGMVEAGAPSPASAVIHIRLLIHLGADGAAWSVLMGALEMWPDDHALRLQQIELASRLAEPRLLEEAIDASARYNDVAAWLARSRSRRALGQTGRAVSAATMAAEVAPADAGVLTELARAQLDHAESLTKLDSRRQHAGNAVVAAQRAMELEPKDDEAYEVLLALYARNGLLGNRALLDDTRLRLAEANPTSRLLALLGARQDVRNGRYERALERLLVLCDSDPTDGESLHLAVTVWNQLGRSDAALRWIERHLRDRPADPVLLNQWVAVQVQLDRLDVARQRLHEVLAREPAHDAARVLLELVYRRQGEIELAVPLAEQRLLARPQGIRRELELAALYAGADMDEAAVRRLQWVLERADDATYDILVSALAVTGRLEAEGARYDPLALEFVERIVARYPEAPLQVYGTGLRALSRMDRIDAQFDQLADRAVRYAGGASGSSVQDAELWMQLAQALVDADQPLAAGRALRARLGADAPLDSPAQSLLATVTLVSDAVANEADASIELVQTLAARGPLPMLPGMQGESSMPEVLYHASIYYSVLGNESGAERLLRETVRLDPNHPMALNNLGYTRLELGFADRETRTWIERAHELAPDDSNVLDTVGWLRYKTGRFQGDQGAPGAVSLIREALDEADNESAEVFDHLGDALWRIGDAEGAVEAWRRAVELLQDSERRDREQQIYMFLQARQWGLLVADPAEIYERQNGPVLTRAREKLQVAEAGGEPEVAATFEELNEAGSTGGLRDGGP